MSFLSNQGRTPKQEQDTPTGSQSVASGVSKNALTPTSLLQRQGAIVPTIAKMPKNQVALKIQRQWEPDVDGDTAYYYNSYDEALTRLQTLQGSNNNREYRINAFQSGDNTYFRVEYHGITWNADQEGDTAFYYNTLGEAETRRDNLRAANPQLGYRIIRTTRAGNQYYEVQTRTVNWERDVNGAQALYYNTEGEAQTRLNNLRTANPERVYRITTRQVQGNTVYEVQTAYYTGSPGEVMPANAGNAPAGGGAAPEQAEQPAAEAAAGDGQVAEEAAPVAEQVPAEEEVPAVQDEPAEEVPAAEEAPVAEEQAPAAEEEQEADDGDGPPAAGVADADLTDWQLAQRIAFAVGVYETNRGGNAPVPVASALETTAGVAASYVSMGQYVASRAVEEIRDSEELREVPDNDLTMAELNGARNRSYITGLVYNWAMAAPEDQTLATFRDTNHTLNRRTRTTAQWATEAGLTADNLSDIFQSRILINDIREAHDNYTPDDRATPDVNEDNMETLLAGIPVENRMGLNEASMRSYIRRPRNLGENQAAWQRIAVESNADVGARIQEVAEDDGGATMMAADFLEQVTDFRADNEDTTVEQVLRHVAGNHNRDANYPNGVWTEYQRLYPAPEADD